jgi:hypothetical protein
MAWYSNGIQNPDHLSGFGMPFENRTGPFLTTSLDHFVMNKMFVMTLFFIKHSRLVDHSKTRPICPVFKCFGGQFAFENGTICPVFECKMAAKVFENRTQKVSGEWQFKNQTVQFRMVTVFKSKRHKIIYSEHPNTGLARYSNGPFWLVLGIWIPDHLKSGQIVWFSDGWD